MEKIDFNLIFMWIFFSIAIYSISSCCARQSEARYKALEACKGTCIY